MAKNEESQLSEVPLSGRCKQILLGGLLGDSSLTLQKNYKNARYQFRHSTTQKEYFLWKFNNLSEIALATPKYSQPDGASKNVKVNFMSRALPALTEIYNIDRLGLGNAELKKLFRLILPLLETPTMLNKFTLRYNDLNYHERWISTMKEALHQFHKEIDAISLEQKARISQRKGKLK